MLNYIKADLYRMSGRLSMWLWMLACLVLPPVFIIGAGTEYETEKIAEVIPVCIYLMFILVSLMLTECVFGEDKRLGLYKNDTTSGISRTALFLAKYLTSALCASVLWIFSSVLCSLALVKLAGDDAVRQSFDVMFSIQSLRWLIVVLMYAALFQTIRVAVNKTSLLILVYAAVSALASQLSEMTQKLFPPLARILSTASIADMNAWESVLFLMLPIFGIAVILTVGCMMFKKSEF